jgi:hypothetical protein
MSGLSAETQHRDLGGVRRPRLTRERIELTFFLIGLVAGLAAAPHCAGMCGGFPLHLARASGVTGTAGSGPPVARGVGRHLLCLGGKTFTYVFLGALAGLSGQFVVQSRLVASQRLLAYAAGAALVILGAAMLHLFPSIRLPSCGAKVARPKVATAAGDACLAARDLLGDVYARFLEAPTSGAGFLLGVGVGFLPCPITLAVMVAAAASHSVALGMMTMAGLGIGTTPVLLGIGLLGATFIRSRFARVRRISLRAAGVIVIALGVITLLRPSGALCRILPIGPSALHVGCHASAQAAR